MTAKAHVAIIDPIISVCWLALRSTPGGGGGRLMAAAYFRAVKTMVCGLN